MDTHQKVLFPGQQANEKVCMVTRAHWIVLAGQILVWLFFAVVLVLFDVFILPAIPGAMKQPIISIINLFKSIYIMAMAAAIFAIWIIYYLNYQIVTDERIVDMTQKNLLYHTISELNLNRIQDVTAEIKGVFGTFFNYGNVYVQTAGEMERFQFDNVPDPHRVAKLILDLYEQLPGQAQTLSKDSGT